MDGIKPWQLAIIIIGLVGGIGLIGWTVFGGKSIDHGDSIVLVDVKTGNLFRMSVKGNRTILLPAKNPDTGERTLLPVDKLENGEWIISPRYTSALSRYKPEERTGITADGKVTAESTNITKIP